MEFKEAEKKINELVEAVKETDVEEVEYASDGISICFRKQPGTEKPDETETDKPVNETKKKKNIVDVFSHSVGKYHDALPPAKKIMGKLGQKVRKGENLGVIESMRIMKEITSPVDGKITAKHIKTNDSVQYGQKLFEIESV